MIYAGKGDLRAARGVVSRAIRKALTKAELERATLVYYPARSAHGSPRYCYNVTDEENKRISAEIRREAEKAGFNRPPGEGYHD